jgi:hypothetical protein
LVKVQPCKGTKLGVLKTLKFNQKSVAIPAIRSKLFCLVFFSRAQKELPPVAFFCQEKIQQSCKRLSTTIWARKTDDTQSG